MYRVFVCLVVLLAAGNAAAQHQHGGATPEAFTATPTFASAGTLWLVRALADKIVVAKSNDLGKTFFTPVPVTSEPLTLDWGPDARPHIAVDGKGDLIVTFAIFQDKRFNGRAFFARSTDGGASFSKPQPLTADTSSQRFETMA